jgi:hypothetical protein
MWKQVNDEKWEGQKSRLGFKIVKKPIGRGQFTYHGYKGPIYIANGKTLEACQRNIDFWVKNHP